MDSDLELDASIEGIRRTAPLPYYAQLAQILRSQISGGRWKAGDLLPSESELCVMYELSRTAVRQALDELVAEGLVQKEKGRGTFVAKPPMSEFMIQEVTGLYDEMRKKGQRVTTELLSQTLVSTPPEARNAFGQAVGAKSILIHRIRRIEGDPVVEVHTYLPYPRFSRLLDVELTQHSLYRTLASDFDVEPRGGRKKIRATVANRELADHLGIDIGSPMLRVEAINFDKRGNPFEYFVAWYRGDHTSFEVTAEDLSDR
ncbi:MAG: GntR family transcriptional regulator [Actinobacteria bacterium]|nr:GntR family transcriptional regulator [Actinomycetota bacterium]